MKYTREQRLDIAQKIYGKEMTIAEAAVRYDLNLSTAKGYIACLQMVAPISLCKRKIARRF